MSVFSSKRLRVAALYTKLNHSQASRHNIEKKRLHGLHCIALLGLIRREHTEGGMGSFGIIIALNIFKDRETELLKGLIMISVNLFFFQIFEKAFAACVIKRIPSF